MELPVNQFKRAIKAGRLQIGLWSSLSSNFTVEILAGSGFDWLLLDTEHAPNELPMVPQPTAGRSWQDGAPDRPTAMERRP